jgi:predicted ferric reductase
MFKNTANFITSIGRLFGLMAVLGVLLQFTLMGRGRWLEETFGLDKLSRIHHTNGNITIFSIVLHPIFITTGYAMSGKTNVMSQFLTIITTYEDTLEALLAVIFFIVIVGSSIYIVRKKLKYEWWYWVHLMTYLAIAFAWGHQLKLGQDFVSKPFTYYWYFIYIFVFGNVLFFRFFLPVFNFFRFKFYVSDIVKETDEATSVYISGSNLSNFRIKPGQFMLLKFLHPKYILQTHPFSLSKFPDGNTLRLTIKSVGDFTQTIPQIPKGTKILIDGPYGIFTEKVQKKSKVLLIAGGIGITPIRSLTEQFAKEEKNIVVMYSNKFVKDTVFKNELDALSKSYNFPVHYFYSQEGTTGRLDVEKIVAVVPDVKDRDVYICGPGVMMNALADGLEKNGVKREQIHFEEFKL